MLSKKLLTKTACINEENECNFEEPYSFLEYNKILVGNADDESIKNKEEQYKNLCRQKNTKLISCCDPNDKKLNNIYDNIDINLRRKFDKIKVTKKGSKIDSIKICPSNLTSEELEEENNDCQDYRKATPYEMCKLLNSKIDPNTGDATNLLPDCYSTKCDPQRVSRFFPNSYMKQYSYFDDIELHNTIVKDDDNYLRTKLSKNSDINRVLVHDSKGNTMLHESLLYNSDKCFNFLLRYNVKLDIKNVLGNTPLHIASILGKDINMHTLMKQGGDINELNLMRDTPLHCAILSGNKRSVLLLLGEGVSVYAKNKMGHTPLHTAVRCKKKQLDIVSLLIDYGADLLTKDNNNNTILKTLQSQPRTEESEKIRTYLNRIYYEKYPDNYKELAKKYPEITPYDIPESENVDYNIDLDYSDNLSDSMIYKKKTSLPIKTNIPSQKLIENFINSDSNLNHKLDKSKMCILLFLIFFMYLLMR